MSKKNLSMTALKAIHRLAPGRKKEFEVIAPGTKFVARDQEEFDFLLKEAAAEADKPEAKKRGRKKAEAPKESPAEAQEDKSEEAAPEETAEAPAEEQNEGSEEVL